MDLSAVTRTLADGSVVAGLPDARTGPPAQDPPPPVGVAYSSPMGAAERVVLLHDPEVRQLIGDLVDELHERARQMGELETEAQQELRASLDDRAAEILARD